MHRYRPYTTTALTLTFVIVYTRYAIAFIIVARLYIARVITKSVIQKVAIAPIGTLCTPIIRCLRTVIAIKVTFVDVAVGIAYAIILKTYRTNTCPFSMT